MQRGAMDKYGLRTDGRLRRDVADAMHRCVEAWARVTARERVKTQLWLCPRGGQPIQSSFCDGDLDADTEELAFAFLDAHSDHDYRFGVRNGQLLDLNLKCDWQVWCLLNAPVHVLCACARCRLSPNRGHGIRYIDTVIYSERALEEVVRQYDPC